MLLDIGERRGTLAYWRRRGKCYFYFILLYGFWQIKTCLVEIRLRCCSEIQEHNCTKIGQKVTRVQEGSLYCENGLLVINDSNHASALRDWTIGADSSNNWPSALLVIHRVQKGVHAWCYKLGFQIMQEAEKRQILKRSISPSYHADVLPYIMALLWKLPSKYQDSHL